MIPTSVSNTRSLMVLKTSRELRLATVATGVLANDSDPDGDTLSVTVDEDPTNGTLILNEDGSFTYTHDGNETTSDSFTYTVTDSNGVSTTAVVELTIAPVNDAPTTTDVVLDSIAEDSVREITAAELLANASDVDGDILNVTSLTIADGNGTLISTGDGIWEYTPANNDNSNVTFSYTISDGVEDYR